MKHGAIYKGLLFCNKMNDQNSDDYRCFSRSVEPLLRGHFDQGPTSQERPLGDKSQHKRIDIYT